MNRDREHAKQIVEIGKMIYRHDWVSATDGNLSMRLDKRRILATPSGIPKGFMNEDQMVIVDMDGNVLEGNSKPSSELKMHLYVYKERPDVLAVIHAHPPITIACTIAGVSLARCVLPEVVVQYGGIPTAEYATPSTDEVPQSISKLVKKTDLLVLERHGTLTLGKTLMDAFLKLEKIEHTAQVTLAARQLGQVRTLNPEQVNKLKQLRKADKQGLFEVECVNCGACGKGGNCSTSHSNQSDTMDDELSSIIEEEIQKVLGKTPPM